MLKQDAYIQGRLVEIALRFGKPYGGYKAGELIMHVLANRVRLGWGNWLQVLDNAPRFMAEHEIPSFEHPPLWEASFIKLLHIVEGVYDGSTPDVSKGALYWGDLNRLEQPWFKEKIVNAVHTEGPMEGLRVHHMVGNMGTLSFWD